MMLKQCTLSNKQNCNTSYKCGHKVPNHGLSVKLKGNIGDQLHVKFLAKCCAEKTDKKLNQLSNLHAKLKISKFANIKEGQTTVFVREVYVYCGDVLS